MKKTLLIALVVLALPGCKDKDGYEQAVMEQMKVDKDINDYKIAPEMMADCVVELSSKEMPGVFGLDPARLMAYRNYTKMLNLKKSADPKKTMEELRVEFGSAKAFADANNNYVSSIEECLQTNISKTEGAEKDKK